MYVNGGLMITTRINNVSCYCEFDADRVSSWVIDADDSDSCRCASWKIFFSAFWLSLHFFRGERCSIVHFMILLDSYSVIRAAWLFSNVIHIVCTCSYLLLFVRNLFIVFVWIMFKELVSLGNFIDVSSKENWLKTREQHLGFSLHHGAYYIWRRGWD